MGKVKSLVIISIGENYKMKYSNELIDKVRDLLSKGFNSVEIGEKLNKHQVTIRNIKVQLKREFNN